MDEITMIYVITNPDLGWDCVIDVCIDKEYVDEIYGTNPDRYCIHEKVVNILTLKKQDCDYIEISDEEADEKELELLIDNLEITTNDGRFNASQTKEAIIFICKKYEEYCETQGLPSASIYLSKFENKYWIGYTEKWSVDEDAFFNWLQSNGIETF